MAREAGVSKSTVQRIWSHNEIKPHRLETFRINIPTIKRWSRPTFAP